MKRMNGYLLFLGAGLIACGYLVFRHVRRSVAPSAARIKTEIRALEEVQGSVKLAPLGDDMTGLRLRLKLRREEEQQRPWEGRN